MSVFKRLAVAPAKLLSKREHILPGKLHVTEFFFKVPLDYTRPGQELTLFGRSVRKHETPIVPPSDQERCAQSKLPYMVYLEGGPGAGNREPQDSPVTRPMLDRGYQVLFLDYRGTGLSTPVNARSLNGMGTHGAVEYLKQMRADNIVRDLEAVRQCLTADFPDEKKKWSLFGQSYGGFVAITYLSGHFESLREVFMTGGLAPVVMKPDGVYLATYQKLTERNEKYFRKFPEDTQSIRDLIAHIKSVSDDGIPGHVKLPSGGYLTAQRLLSLGIGFGMHGGLDSVHTMILRLATDLSMFGYFTRATLTAFEQQLPFDTMPIYAILHEAIYCKQGISSSWAAHRVGLSLPGFSWLDGQEIDTTKPLYFSGEMVYPFFFETYPELSQMRPVADKLAEFDGWEGLYNVHQLERNEVPVYAASFIDDMFVDIKYARITAELIRGTKVYETNGMYHNALRARTDEVLGELFRMRDDSID